MFNTYLVIPLYNAFIYILSTVPGADVGIAIIIITVIVRAIFYPIFASSIRTSMAMQKVRPQLDEINEKYKDNVEERSRRTMELFKAHRIRPISSIVSTVLQLVVLIALYWALFRTGLPEISKTLLYPFVSPPEAVKTEFLGFLDLFTSHHIILAVVVGILQYLVMLYSLDRMQGAMSKGTSPERQMANKMQNYMLLYFMPAMIAVISYTFPAAVGIYFAATSVISLGQEWLIRRKPL